MDTPLADRILAHSAHLVSQALEEDFADLALLCADEAGCLTAEYETIRAILDQAVARRQDEAGEQVYRQSLR